MKLLVGLTVFFMMTGLTFYLAGTQRIHALVTGVLLTFSLLSGFVITNHDWLNHLRFEVPGLETYQDQVVKIRDTAVQEIRNETRQQKQEILDLLAEHEDVTARLESQKKSLDGLLDSIRSAENEFKGREQLMKEMVTRGEQMRDQIVAVQNESSELALLLTRVIWLHSQAATQQNPERRDAAIKQVMDGLDAVVGLIIPDQQARSEFISGVMSTLPPSQR
jgi:hypothetical protein